MSNWWEKFRNENIFFVTPDVKRGLGVEDLLQNYHIICSFFDPIIPILRNQGANIFCLEESIETDSSKINNSGKLLEHPLVSNYISKYSQTTPHIIYFKPSVKLDLLIRRKGYLPVSNNSELNEQFENKINFFNLLLRHFPQLAIPSELGILGNLSFKKLANKLGLPFVVQFGHGWAGKTTFFIESEGKFVEISQKFSHTKVKVSRKIDGFTVLNNCCVYKNLVLISPPAIQLSDIDKLYKKPGVTCGRQWPAKFLTGSQINNIYDISQKIGKIMSKGGFKGFFGLDFLVESNLGKIYLSEINARLTASTSFYTRLERGFNMAPLFVYHLAAFLNKSLNTKYKITNDIAGSQIIFRSSSHKPVLSTPSGFGVFAFKDSKPVLVEKGYSPEKLDINEFIYMDRLVKNIKTTDEEIARLETKREVLEKPTRLKSWVRNLLQKNISDLL